MVVVSGERGEMVVVVEAGRFLRAWLYVDGGKWRRWNGERSLAIWGSFGLRGHVIGGARVPSPSPDLGVTPPRARASPRFAAVALWRELFPRLRVGQPTRHPRVQSRAVTTADARRASRKCVQVGVGAMDMGAYCREDRCMRAARMRC